MRMMLLSIDTSHRIHYLHDPRTSHTMKTATSSTRETEAKNNVTSSRLRQPVVQWVWVQTSMSTALTTVNTATTTADLLEATTRAIDLPNNLHEGPMTTGAALLCHPQMVPDNQAGSTTTEDDQQPTAIRTLCLRSQAAIPLLLALHHRPAATPAQTSTHTSPRTANPSTAATNGIGIGTATDETTATATLMLRHRETIAMQIVDTGMQITLPRRLVVVMAEMGEVTGEPIIATLDGLEAGVLSVMLRGGRGCRIGRGIFIGGDSRACML